MPLVSSRPTAPDVVGFQQSRCLTRFLAVPLLAGRLAAGDRVQRQTSRSGPMSKGRVACGHKPSDCRALVARPMLRGKGCTNIFVADESASQEAEIAPVDPQSGRDSALGELGAPSRSAPSCEPTTAAASLPLIPYHYRLRVARKRAMLATRRGSDTAPVRSLFTKLVRSKTPAIVAIATFRLHPGRSWRETADALSAGRRERRCTPPIVGVANSPLQESRARFRGQTATPPRESRMVLGKKRRVRTTRHAHCRGRVQNVS